VPDSNVVQIDWFRNNQLVKQVSRKYLSEGQPVLGNFNGWINNIPFHWGMGDFHIHTDGSIYISDMHDKRVVRYFPSTGQFTVVAGGNGSGNALNQLDNPQGVFVTSNGDVYVADYGNHRVVRWSPGASAGVVVAGATGQAGSALNRLHGPLDVFVDQIGQMFIADEQNHRVMRWAPNATSGVLVAGSTGQVGSALNQLHSPVRVFVSNSGLLYVSDISNNRVMRYAPGSSTGTVVAGGNGAGIGLQQLNTPIGIFVDQTEALYIADLQNNRVVKWNNGATAGQVVSNNDSLSMPNRVNQPRSVAIGPNKELYVVSNSQLLLKFGFDAMTSDLLVPENAGSYFVKMLTKQGCENSSMPSIISSPDVNLQSSLGFDVCEGDTTQLSTIQNATYTYRWLKDGIQVAGATNSFINVSQPGLYQVEVTDSNSCLRSSETLRVWPKPLVSLTADGVCLGSELLTNTPDSQVVQIDWFRNNQLFRNTRANFKANGSAHLGYFNGLWLRDIEFQGAGISDVHVHQDGAMYVLAQTNQFSGISVLKYTPNANAFVLVAGGNGFGSALNQIGGFGAASFGYGGLFVAENGDIYVADRTNHRVVKWTPGAAQGIVVAGGNGSGSALNQLSNPQSVFVNGSGDVFVVDQSNHRVVRWSISANTGVVVAGGNGLGAGLTQFNNPRFVTATSNGDLYISDQNNHRVVRYAAGASAGVVVAGGNFSGTALNQLNQPNGIAVDKSGNVFVADRFNDRIVRWAPGSTSGEVVAGLNLGNASGLDRTTRPVSLKLGSDYRLYVTSVDTVNGSINLNSSNRLMSFELNRLVADTLRAQQGGNYSVVFTNITGCSNGSQELNVFDPQVNFPALANSCISDASLLLNTATPVGGTYFGLGVDTGYFHPSIAGVGSHMLYYLYTDSNGCSKLDSQTIQVVPEPVVSIDTLGSMNLCQGESVVLQSPLVTGQTYQWYRNGVLIPQATQRAFTVLDTVSAQYHVMVTRNVCEKSSDTLEVVVRPKPVVTITNQGAATICQGDSVVLQAASDTDVTYQWYRNNQLLVGSTQSSLVANQSGSYTCQVIKANGCADTSNVLALTVLDFPIAQITPASATTVCDGQIVLLNANQAADLTHRWFRNGVLIPGATSANYQATTSGDYTVEVKRQQLCETLSQAVTVVVNPLPQISIAVAQGNQFCSGDSILITAQSTAQVLRYAWFRNGQLTPSDSTANFYATLPGHYHARVFDSAGCDQASDSVLVGYFNPPFANEAICAISVDTLAGRNVVVWEKTAGVRTSSYNVYREGAISGQYNLIGNVPYDSLSIFIDTTANPLSQSYRYRIATVDSCGFVSAQSSIHRTIHLSSNIGVNNEVNLFWTTYEGVVVPTHRILRSINGGPFVEIASVSGTTFTYTDLTPPQGAKNYLIEIAIPGGCNPTGLRLGNLRTASSYGSIQSNKVAVGSGVSVINRSLAGLHTLYPNPSNGLLTLVRSEQQMGDQVFKIYDARGRLVKTIRFEDQSLVYQIDMVEAADGIYTIRANDSNWSARFMIAK
jgi:sugar lactone lactonase YvrE